MQTKRPDRPKLQFFSESHIENLEREINSVIQLAKDGRISIENALNRLHAGKIDALSVYWDTVTKIGAAQSNLRTIADYQQLKKPVTYPPANKILKELLTGFDNFQAGKIDYQQWESIAVKCLSRIKGETQSVKNEISDILRQSKRLIKSRQESLFDEQDERIKAYKQATKDIQKETKKIDPEQIDELFEEIPDRDMNIQKIDANDDLAQ